MRKAKALSGNRFEYEGIEFQVNEKLLCTYLESIESFEKFHSPNFDRERRRAHNQFARQIEHQIRDEILSDEDRWARARTIAASIAITVRRDSGVESEQHAEIANLRHYANSLRELILPLSEVEFENSSLHRRAAHNYAEQVVESIDRLLRMKLELHGVQAGQSYKSRFEQAEAEGLLPEGYAKTLSKLSNIRNNSVHANPKTKIFRHLRDFVAAAEGFADSNLPGAHGLGGCS